MGKRQGMRTEPPETSIGSTFYLDISFYSDSFGHGGTRSICGTTSASFSVRKKYLAVEADIPATLSRRITDLREHFRRN